MHRRMWCMGGLGILSAPFTQASTSRSQNHVNFSDDILGSLRWTQREPISPNLDQADYSNVTLCLLMCSSGKTWVHEGESQAHFFTRECVPRIGVRPRRRAAATCSRWPGGCRCSVAASTRSWGYPCCRACASSVQLLKEQCKRHKVYKIHDD